MIGGQEVYQEVCIATCRHRPQVFDESWTEFIYFWYEFIHKMTQVDA